MTEDLLEVLAQNSYEIKGTLLYHDLPSIGHEAKRVESSLIQVDLLENPLATYRGTGEKWRAIQLVLPGYDDPIIARGGNDMTEHYETICSMVERGAYTLHLFSNRTFGFSELHK